MTKHRTSGPDLLRARLSVLGWTQEELASRVGVTPPAVSRVLSGQTTPSLSLAWKLQRETGVPVEAWLVERGTGTDG